MKEWFLKINNLEDRRVIIAYYLNDDMIDEKYQMKYEDIKIQTIYDVDECYLGMTGILKTRLQ
jgi:hypothetical protein